MISRKLKQMETWFFQRWMPIFIPEKQNKIIKIDWIELDLLVFFFLGRNNIMSVFFTHLPSIIFNKEKGKKNCCSTWMITPLIDWQVIDYWLFSHILFRLLFLKVTTIFYRRPINTLYLYFRSAIKALVMCYTVRKKQTRDKFV